MNYRHILRFCISAVLALSNAFSAGAQNDTTAVDTPVFERQYGLRLGGDLGKIIRTLADDEYTGFEINADYRYSKNLYIAGEIGTEEKTTTTDFLNTTSTGGYLKAGVDYNLYTNWLDMDNMIYSGFRVGLSSFKQTINSYTIYNTNQVWQPPTTITEAREFKGLNAIWAEVIFGIKAEVVSNLYVGLNAQLKARVSETEPDNFENIFIPGFGRTYDSGRFGIGFGYNVSYLIPLYKKGN